MKIKYGWKRHNEKRWGGVGGVCGRRNTFYDMLTVKLANYVCI